MSNVLVLLLAVPVIVGCSALGSLVFMFVWNSFVASVFTSLPVLTFLQAWGISFFLSIVGGYFRGSK